MSFQKEMQELRDRVEASENGSLNGHGEKSNKGNLDLSELEDALREHQFRYNTITCTPEILDRTWTRVDDYRLNTLVRDLRSRKIKFASRTRVAELLESDFVPKINPIEAYFKSLPKSEEGSDPIGELCATVDPIAGPEMFDKYLRKWLVGAVANVFITDRCANQLCFILAGPQGTFKSTWIRLLCPPALLPYYVEGAIDPENKDSIAATTSNFIFNIDDYFAAVTSRKINELKGLLTKNTVKIRRPYARYAEELPKICSFIASSNEGQFLHDPTGNRRFLPFEVKSIDIKAAQDIDIDQVWAQAYKLFRSDFMYWLSLDDQNELNQYNEQFEVSSNEYEVLVTWMRPPADDCPTADLTNAEILAHLQEKTSLKLSARKIGEALRKAEFPRYQKMRNGRRSWVYGIDYADEADLAEGRQPTSRENTPEKDPETDQNNEVPF